MGWEALRVGPAPANSALQTSGPHRCKDALAVRAHVEQGRDLRRVGWWEARWFPEDRTAELRFEGSGWCQVGKVTEGRRHMGGTDTRPFMKGTEQVGNEAVGAARALRWPQREGSPLVRQDQLCLWRVPRPVWDEQGSSMKAATTQMTGSPGQAPCPQMLEWTIPGKP